MQVKLTDVKKYTTKKDGTPLMANGRPFTSLRIKTAEHGDKILSGFENPQNKDWKVGDTVEIDVEQNGEYWNFSTPKLPKGYSLPSQTQEDIAFLKIAVGRCIAKLDELLMLTGGKATAKIEYPEDDEYQGMPFQDE